MVYFQTKNPNLGKFPSVLHWKRLVNFKAIWSILLPFRIFYGHLVILVYFSVLVPRKIWQPCFIDISRFFQTKSLSACTWFPISRRSGSTFAKINTPKQKKEGTFFRGELFLREMKTFFSLFVSTHKLFSWNWVSVEKARWITQFYF
jgi:hypothetical protein